uniref:Uncharacterized protein n=1 Tax=viral metagenome TaxID=1070528 RepID=A0A6C0B268_9ZZZZ
MEYDTLTDQINTAVSSKEISWESVPGGLDKVSASAMGFLWGMGGGRVWVCQLPCAGNWKQVDMPVSSSLRDIVTDDTHIYVLFQDKLAMKLANNTDEWVVVQVPDDISKIISTSSYIWGQAGTQKYKLPKPGMTGNWIPVKDDMNIKVTSASSGHLYGVDSKGQAMITDEAMQTSWATIPEFGGKYAAIYGEADQTALFGIDSENSLKRCLNGKCQGVDTQGYTPQNITIEPSTKQMWMTTTTSGKSGNIFNQPLVSDYTDILKTVQPIDKKRDEVVDSAKVQYDQATYSGMMSKQFALLKKMVATLFNIKPASSHEEDSKVLQGDIDNATYELNILRDILPFIQKLLIVLALTIVVYAASDYLGSATHVIALAVLIAGTVFFAINK